MFLSLQCKSNPSTYIVHEKLRNLKLLSLKTLLSIQSIHHLLLPTVQATSQHKRDFKRGLDYYDPKNEGSFEMVACIVTKNELKC